MPLVVYIGKEDQQISPVLQNPIKEEFFSRPESRPQSSGDVKEPTNRGRTLRLLMTHLPFLLKDGALPAEILSDSIRLELLPSTIGLPEIKGKSTYLAVSKLGAWSINTLYPKGDIVVESQKMVGSVKQYERLIVRFKIMDGNEVLYTGLFHFHFDSDGKVSKHVLEVVDSKFHPNSIVNWLIGKRSLEKNLGYCYERCEHGQRS